MSRQLALRAVAVYLGIRLASGLLLWVASTDQVPFLPWTGPDPGYLDLTVLWDGTWYRHVAETGYPVVLPRDAGGLVGQNEWAFYPAFPLLARAVMWPTGLPFPLVGSSVAVICGLVAAVLMVGLLAKRLPGGVALAAMAVWAAFPSAPSLQIAYSEGTAMLVLVAWLWLVVERRWLLTGVMSLVVGVTRPIAVPVFAVLAVALWLRWRDRRLRPVGREEALAAASAVVLTGVGAVLWPLVAWVRTGSRTAYTDTMASWRIDHVIKPFSGWVSITEWALRSTSRPQVYAPVLLAVLVCGLLVAVLGPWATRLGAELRTWSLAYPAYLVAVLDPFTSVFRYALPLFPLAVVFIGAGRPDRPSRAWRIRAGVLVAVGFALQVAWIWKLLVFHPPTDYPP